MFLQSVGAIARTYRHVRRYREITSVLLKHGFGDLVVKLGLHRHFHRGKTPASPLPEADTPTRDERTRMVLEELGPTFVKLGQVLSTRQDIIPPSLVVELTKLQDAVPGFPADQARARIEEELGGQIEAHFSEFSEVPLACGSIGQVHQAVTLAGDRVVVKVQRPGIRDLVETDLEIIAHLAALAERFVDGAAVFSPRDLVRQFARTISRELDFGAEANHMRRVSQSFRDDPRLHVPTVHADLSSERVLTMEYITGVSVSRVEELSAAGLDQGRIATAAVEIICRQVFVHGFYHADPHPGNIVILPGNVVCFLDYGMVGVLSSRYREQLSALILGMVNRDERQITNAVFRLSGFNRYEQTERIEVDVANFVEDHFYKALAEIRMGDVLNELTRLLMRYDISMPADFFILTKALATIDGVCRRLAPDLDIMQVLKPFASQLLRQQLGIKRKAGQLYMMMLEAQTLIRDLPTDVRQIVAMVKRGEVNVRLEHRGLEDLQKTLDQVSNRASFALVLGALIIGSSLMVLSDIPPKLGDRVPVIGAAGFLFSALVGAALLYSIIRHNKL